MAWFSPKSWDSGFYHRLRQKARPGGLCLLAPQMRRWEVDTCRTKRAGLLQTTGIVTEVKDPGPHPICWCCPRVSIESPVSQATWMVGHPIAWPDPCPQVESLEMLRLSGLWWWPGSRPATHLVVHSACCLRRANDKMARLLPQEPAEGSTGANVSLSLWPLSRSSGGDARHSWPLLREGGSTENSPPRQFLNHKG